MSCLVEVLLDGHFEKEWNATGAESARQICLDLAQKLVSAWDYFEPTATEAQGMAGEAQLTQSGPQLLSLACYLSFLSFPSLLCFRYLAIRNDANLRTF